MTKYTAALYSAGLLAATFCFRGFFRKRPAGCIWLSGSEHCQTLRDTATHCGRGCKFDAVQELNEHKAIGNHSTVPGVKTCSIQMHQHHVPEILWFKL